MDSWFIVIVPKENAVVPLTSCSLFTWIAAKVCIMSSCRFVSEVGVLGQFEH